MKSRPSFCLRILLWLLMLADGEDNEGNAVRFPSFRPTSRQRLMTDNFLPTLPSSSRSIPFSGVIGYQGASGPRFHSNRGLDQMETPKSSQFQAFAIYPGYGTGRPSTFGQENSYGRPLNPSSHSPFRNLFGSDIGRPSSGIHHSFVSPRKEKAFDDARNGLEMGKSDFQSHRNYPFSSLRLTPITKVSGVSVAGPNGQPNARSDERWRDTSFDGAFGGNRAHSFDHENPFEKPISRSAFPLPDVNDPITLDLAEDERKRVNYARDTNRLPPPRNFVYKPDSKISSSVDGNGKADPTISDKGLGPLDGDFTAGPFKNKRLTSIAIPELPSKKKSIREQNDLARLLQGEPETMNVESDGLGEEGDVHSATDSESDGKSDNRHDPSSNDAGVLMDTLDDDSRSGKESHFSNSKVSGPTSISTPNNHEGGSEKQEEEGRQPMIENVDSSKGGYDVDQDNIVEANVKDYQSKSEDVLQNSLSEESAGNTRTPQGSSQNNFSPEENEGYPNEDRPGVYDITTLTQETIQKKSGHLPDEINLANNNNGIPATKRITEQTIESGRRTVVNNETNLPTDHVGFILTDQFYDDDGEGTTATSSSVIEQPEDGVSPHVLMADENADEGLSDREFLRTDPGKFIFAPDFGMKENSGSEIISAFPNVDTLESDSLVLDRPPVGSSYLFQTPGTKVGGVQNPIEESKTSASSNGQHDPHNHFPDAILSPPSNGFDEKANDIQVNEHEHALAQEDEYHTRDDVTYPQKLSQNTHQENRTVADRWNSDEGRSNDAAVLATTPNKTERRVTMLTKDTSTSTQPVTDQTPQPEAVPLSLGVMKEGDASMSDKQKQSDNRDYSMNDRSLGNATNGAGSPYSWTSDERQLITLENMNQYLEEDDDNKGNASTTDSVHENIDENGMPDFGQYNYDTYGPSRGDFSPTDSYNYNDGVDDDFSIETDPTSLKFNVLEAGEGSLSVRKVSNTFDPDHKDVSTVKTSLGSAEESNLTTEPEDADHHSDKMSEEDHGFEDANVPDTNTRGPDKTMSAEDQLSIAKEKDPDVSSIEDSDPQYEDLFKPPSSYEKIEFAEPSDDAFSSSSAFGNNQGPESSSLLLSSPFQSMFGKTVDQAEKDSFGSLFQNLPNADKNEYAGPRKGSNLQQDGGLFGGGSLFDERLGQIIQSRPSLDLFGKRRK